MWLTVSGNAATGQVKARYWGAATVHPHYQLGIDLGTTWTAAALCRGDDGRPEVVTLGTAGAAVASVAFVAPDGSLLTGEPAQRRAPAEPTRVVREFKRRIGDGTPLVVGGQPVPAEVLAARFVARVVAEVAEREGGPARAVCLTHPVAWGEHKQRCLAAALAAEGLSDVEFLTEPQAAALAYASAERVEPGRTVAVYDLGGGTFDAAVVRRADDGTFAPVGRPAGIEHLGGVDFDDAVFAHVREAVGAAWDALDPDDPATQTAVATLRREITAAKETLSADVEVLIPVMLPGLHTTVRLGRAEFEDMIRPAVAETVEALRRAVASADGDQADLAAVLLVGGSSRIPLVAQLVSAELGRPVAVDTDPKLVVASGAALAATSRFRPVTAPVDSIDDDVAPPVGPPVAFDAAPGAGAPVGRRRPRAGVLVAAAAAVAAVFGVSAAMATGVTPVSSTSVGEDAAVTPVDPWTGDPLAADVTDPAAGAGTPEAVTTPAGPRRARAVAAAVRPVARNVPTGAAGAGRSVAPPAARVVAPAPAPQRPPAAPGQDEPSGGGTPPPASGTPGGGTSNGGGTDPGGTDPGGTNGGGTSGGGTDTGGTDTGGTDSGGTDTGGTDTGGTDTGGTDTGGTDTGGTDTGGTDTGGTDTGGTAGGSTDGGGTASGPTTGEGTSGNAPTTGSVAEGAPEAGSGTTTEDGAAGTGTGTT